MSKRTLAAPDDETRAALDRESRAMLPSVASGFAECAKTFGAEIGSNGWARCSGLPPEALAACLDPIISPLAARHLEDSGNPNAAARRVLVHRIFNQVQHTIERTRPPACFPFMPFDLFDASSAVSGAIVDHIERVVKGTAANTKQPRGRPPIPESLKTTALQIRAAGGSNRKAAMAIYDTKMPTAQQVSSASTILREFKKKTGHQV